MHLEPQQSSWLGHHHWSSSQAAERPPNFGRHEQVVHILTCVAYYRFLIILHCFSVSFYGLKCMGTIANSLVDINTVTVSSYCAARAMLHSQSIQISDHFSE